MKDTQPFPEEFKVIITDENDFKKVQLITFSYGYAWQDSGQKMINFPMTTIILYGKDGLLYWWYHLFQPIANINCKVEDFK